MTTAAKTQEIDLKKLGPSLEVHDIKAILKCGRKQAYELVNSGAFHVVKVGTKFKISTRVFFAWYEGEGFAEWFEQNQRTG